MSRLTTITGAGAQPLARPAPIAPSLLQAGTGAIQAAAQTVSRFAQASIARDQRMLLTQHQTDLITGVETARTEALNSANPTEAAEMFDKSIELLTQRVDSIDNEDVRFEASQFLERRALGAKSSLINESTRKATAEDLIILDTFLKQATLEGDVDEAQIQIFDRVGTTLTQGQAESMFRAFQVDTQLEFMNQVIRTEPQNFDAFMQAGSFDLLNEGTLLAATGMASRAHVQFHKVDSERAFNAAKDDINDLMDGDFKPDSLANSLEFHTEVILSEPGNERSSDEIQTALLGPGLTAAAAELKPDQFEAIAALMPKTPENRELIADQRDEMNKSIVAQQVTAEGADVIGAVLDHGAKDLKLPRDVESWNKYANRRFVSGDSVSDVAVDIIGAGQPLPPSIINPMKDMSSEGTLDTGGLLTIYENMSVRDATALASSLPNPEFGMLLVDTVNNTSGDERRRRLAALENPRVRAAIPDAAIRFDGGKIGDEKHDSIDVNKSLGNLLGGQTFRQFFLDPKVILTPDQRDSIRESFIIDAASQVGLQGLDLKDGDVDSIRDRALKDFSVKFRMYTIDTSGRNDVAFTDQFAGSFTNRERYQKGLSDWQTPGTKQPGMIFNLDGMQVTPAVHGGIVDSFMVFDPQGKAAIRVIHPTEAGFSEARDMFYGLVPPQERVERPDLVYQTRYGDKRPEDYDIKLAGQIMDAAKASFTQLTGRPPDANDRSELSRMYEQKIIELGWPTTISESEK